MKLKVRDKWAFFWNETPDGQLKVCVRGTNEVLFVNKDEVTEIEIQEGLIFDVLHQRSIQS